MIYYADTAPGAKVYDVDTKQEICFVLSVDDTAGWVEVAEFPLRVTEDECIASRRIQFSSIYAIKGGEPWPLLFHCYGKVEDVMPSRSNGCREWRDATAKDVAELAASKGRNESVGAVTLKIDVDSKDARVEIAKLTAMVKQLTRELEHLVPIGGARVETK